MKTKKFAIYAVALVLTVLCVVSCNKNNDDDEIVVYNSVSTSTVLIDGFNLVANSDVMENLDSVFFTIDLDNFTIYNADSLPVGTDITALQVNMTFDSAVGEAEFSITDASVQDDTTFVYTSTEPEIDFTGNVKVKVTSLDGTLTKTYSVKVNVHQMEPDSLYWNKNMRRNLPGAGSKITAQKMTGQLGGYFHLVATDGKYVLSVAKSLASNEWDSQEVEFPMTPNVATFTATDEALYILSDAGELYESTDGLTWDSCDVKWTWISGNYGDRVLGVLNDAGEYKYDEYPRRDGFKPSEIDDNFPVSASSPMVYADNDWVLSPQGMIAGGRLADGTYSNAIWGYDGIVWGRISDTRLAPVLPEVEAPIMFSYFSFDTNTLNLRISEHPTLFFMGGRDASGVVNEQTYVSLDQGILWAEGTDLVQLPNYIPAPIGAQVFVEELMLTRGAAAPARAGAVKPVTEWPCPFIYVVGGCDEDGNVQNSIWRGAINRLTFVPIY